MDNDLGVHVSHCCKLHGCKYGDDDCPVVNGEVEQLYVCEECLFDEIESFDDLNYVI